MLLCHSFSQLDSSANSLSVFHDAWPRESICRESEREKERERGSRTPPSEGASLVIGWRMLQRQGSSGGFSSVMEGCGCCEVLGSGENSKGELISMVIGGTLVIGRGVDVEGFSLSGL